MSENSFGAQSSGAVWKSRQRSWAPIPNKPTSVDVKQHSTNQQLWCKWSSNACISFFYLLLWLFFLSCFLCKNLNTGCSFLSGSIAFSLQFMTSCDFAHALVPVTGLGARGMCVVDYLSELSLLQAHLAKYSPAEVAASCVLLAHVLLKDGEWFTVTCLFTSVTVAFFFSVSFSLSLICFYYPSVA